MDTHMDGKQQLIDMIVSTNREVIEANNVVLDASSLDLSLPRAGSFEGGANTVVTAAAMHDKVEGNQSFYYNRLTQVLFLELLGNPTILIPKAIQTTGQLIAYFADTYNVDIDPAQVQSAILDYRGWVVKFFTWSYVWVGTFTFEAVDAGRIPLSAVITKTLVDGLYYPDINVRLGEDGSIRYLENGAIRHEDGA